VNSTGIMAQIGCGFSPTKQKWQVLRWSCVPQSICVGKGEWWIWLHRNAFYYFDKIGQATVWLFIHNCDVFIYFSKKPNHNILL